MSMRHWIYIYLVYITITKISFPYSKARTGPYCYTLNPCMSLNISKTPTSKSGNEASRRIWVASPAESIMGI